MINNVSRTLVYSKRHSSEILVNAIYWSWRSILSSSKEHPVQLPFIWMNNSSQIRGHSCGLLLPATIEWRATWILCAFWRASHWFPSLLNHVFGLDEQESNSRVEGTILPASIQRSAILVMFKIQWFRACWPRSSRSRPNDWTLHCMLQLGTFPNHSGKSRNVSIIWF